MLGLVLMIGLMALYAYERDLYGQYINYQGSQQDLRALRQRVQEEEAKVEQVQRRVNMLSTDPVEMEATIRREKGLLREGERVYRVELEPSATGSGQPGG